MSALQPAWARKGGPDSKAHLHHLEYPEDERLGDFVQAMCGTNASGEHEGWTLDPHVERCSHCLKALEAFVERAMQKPDPLITESVTVTVTRKAIDAAREPLEQAVARDLRKHKSWTTVVRPYGEALP